MSAILFIVNAAPWFVLMGDTLLVGAIGRPDLAGCEREMANMLYETLHDELLTHPDAIEIYPGHQAGSVCRAGLSGKPSSTLAFEKRWNPALSQAREAYVDALLAQIPSRPLAMDRIVAQNIAA
ncbi:MAG: hypothetical protein HIU89_15340 [Proteobacteria bacterium]|nr:hypothetical protein [Pseudomonadota bacterium]